MTDDRTQSPAAAALRVVRAPENGRYEAWDGQTLAGYAEYNDTEDGLRVFSHTLVDPGYGGRGIAGQLARKALDDSRADGRRVVPRCSFFESYIAKHPDYAELVASG